MIRSAPHVGANVSGKDEPRVNCTNCGAALPPKSGVCRHCGTRNEIDLRGLFDVARRTPDDSRLCPQCDQHLEQLDLGLGAALFIERCGKCLGLFFDPGELEFVTRLTVDPFPRIDRQRLQKLLDEEAPPWPDTVRYLKCPTCRQLMNRKSYGARAGVIVDRCHPHGVWLDGGELRQILKWTQNGGEQIEAERRAAEARAAASREKNDRLNSESVLQSSVWEGGDPWTPEGVVGLMVSFIESMIGRR